MSGIELHLADYGAVQVHIDRTDDAAADLEDGLQSLGIISKLLALDKDQKAALVGRLVAAVTASTPAPQAASAPAQRRSGGPKKGTALFCADHPNVQVIETKAEWQEMNDEGLPDKFFCPGKENGTGENHNVYRRQAVLAGTVPERDVDADVSPMEQEMAGLTEDDATPF